MKPEMYNSEPEEKSAWSMQRSLNLFLGKWKSLNDLKQRRENQIWNSESKLQRGEREDSAQIRGNSII